jgi:hypothetical protein
MEVASPLSFAPTAGNKRSLAYSPQMIKSPNRGSIAEMDVADDSMQHSTKRRRFNSNSDTSVESLSEHFSSHSPFFAQSKQSIFASSTGTSHHGIVTTEFCCECHCDTHLPNSLGVFFLRKASRCSFTADLIAVLRLRN